MSSNETLVLRIVQEEEKIGQLKEELKTRESAK